MLDLLAKYRTLRLWLLFVPLAVLIVSLLALDFQPVPIYPSKSRDAEMIPCPASNPLIATMRLPSRRLEYIEFYARIQLAPLKVVAENASNDTILAQAVFRQSGKLQLPFPSAGGIRKLRLRFTSDSANPARVPLLVAAKDSPIWDIKLKPLDSGNPLMIFHFGWISIHALWIWLLIPVGAWLAWKKPGWMGGYLVLLAVCAMIGSILLWQRNYLAYYGHWDADGYGDCAEHLANFLTNAEPIETTRQFLRDFPHSATALGPALISLPIALGAPPIPTYLVFSALCGFGSLLLFLRILQRHLRVSHPLVVVGVTLFALHWLQVRSFARPITDEFGMLIVMAMLMLLIWRCEERTPIQSFWLSALIFIMPLARPQGISYVPFLLAAVLAVDCWREKELAVGKRLMEAARLAAIPGLLFAALFLGFDWGHNIQLSFQKLENFKTGMKPLFSRFAVFAALQWLPLVVLWAKRETFRRPAIVLLAAWICFYSAMLLAVRAPMIARHFIPLLPALIALCVTAIEDNRSRRFAGIPWLLMILLCILNVASIVFQIVSTSPNTAPATLRALTTSG